VLVEQVDRVDPEPLERPSTVARMLSGWLLWAASPAASTSPNFVAITTWSRTGASASPTSSSERRTLGASGLEVSALEFTLTGDQMARIAVMDTGASVFFEDVVVLRHAVASDGLRDDDDVSLDEPPEHDLRDRLAVRGTDLGQRRVGEHVVAALGKGTPRFDLHAAGPYDLLVGVALEVGMRLDLIDRWGHRVVLDEVHEAVRVEVGHADRPDQPLGVELLHGTPEAVDVAEGLVDQVQVEVVATTATRT
jgi:hypothetical protein